MALIKEERQLIEMRGVPYVIASIVKDWGVDITNIEMVTDKYKQWNGEDFIITDTRGKAIIDSKYHKAKMKKQELTSYGVDVLSIEIVKSNGKAGWGISNTTTTDYIIDMIHDVGYYIIDAKRLKEYMIDSFYLYPIMYSNEGLEDYRAVSVKDLIEYEVILHYGEFTDIEDKANSYLNGCSDDYNKYIRPLIGELKY